jgi:hypothetical protein
LAGGLADGVKDGNLLARVLKDLAALAGGDAGHDARAVIEGELGVPGAKTAGDALDEDLRVGFNENGHGKIMLFFIRRHDILAIDLRQGRFVGHGINLNDGLGFSISSFPVKSCLLRHYYSSRNFLAEKQTLM